MKHVSLSLSLTALLLGGTMVGCTANGPQGIASASDHSMAAAEKQAVGDADKAQAALAQRNGDKAVRFAEAAVQLAPRNANYRMILAHSYLQAGRFVSARQAYADVLTLVPDDHALVGKASLNLALAETAAGDWAAARKTLDEHAHDIPVGDLGLALALAGNPNGAVTILTQAARTDQSDAKLRQNLALSFALAGNWMAARATAAVDMSPADVDARLEQWAQFAQPQHAYDQVATLLRVTAAADQGQPAALALVAPVPMSVPVAPIAEAAPAVRMATVEPTPSVEAPLATSGGVVFAAAHEVVQPLPVKLIRADARATKVAVATAKPAPVIVQKLVSAPVAAKSDWAKGDWYVQFGAYENAAVARDGWARIQRRYVLSDLSPTGMNFTTKAGSFYRLSVGGFAHDDANRLCAMVRRKGGNCFVRKDAGGPGRGMAGASQDAGRLALIDL